LVARARGPEWLHTYLRNFYADDSRPYGVNNRVFPDVGMPHVLEELQGLQECAPGPVHDVNGGNLRDKLTGENKLFDNGGKALSPCGDYTLVREGSLAADEYDAVVYDLVNFLEYMAEPIQAKRKQMGIYVLLFIALFFVFTYLLNREYWKDVH
jgi:ubiquinol-cytochrome c reductase cytochrome b subunit